MIEEFHDAVKVKLNANSTLSDLGVYFAQAPSVINLNTTDGYIVWNSTFGDTDPFHGDDIEISELTVWIYSRSLATINTLHKEVMRQMDDSGLTITGYSHIHTQRTLGNDLPERDINTRQWKQNIVYEVMYQ